MTRERRIYNIIVESVSYTKAARNVEDMMHTECTLALQDLLCAMEDDCHESGYSSVVQEWVTSYIEGYKQK